MLRETTAQTPSRRRWPNRPRLTAGIVVVAPVMLAVGAGAAWPDGRRAVPARGLIFAIALRSARSPAIVTIALAIGVRHGARRAVVRRLPAVRDAGQRR
jgi:hypothetical protein